MTIRIEEAFNDCFERMLSGESLESCISRYPEYAIDLDSMLKTSYDVKRKAYPIQPRPEFKYWARVRMQGVQDYAMRSPVVSKPVSFNLRRNLAITMAAMLVFVIVSSGTVAASSDAMPDEPLYGVKLAVEQARVTFAPSDEVKAEIYANMVEKRAQEISVMAIKGKNDKVIATTAIMKYQLQQVEQNLLKFETEPTIAATSNAGSSVKRAPSGTGNPLVQPSAGNLPPVPPTVSDNDTDDNTEGQKQGVTILSAQRAANIKKTRETVNASTAKSLTILQNALDKVPDSVKPSINNVINQTKTTNKRFNPEDLQNKDGKSWLQNNNINNLPDKPTTNTNIKPNINKNTVVNPADRIINKPPIPDNTRPIK